MYVAAVETPDQLYKDYVERPAEKLQTLRNQEREQASALKNADEKSRPLAKAKLDKTKRELARAEKIVKQRRELFGIIRNDVFGAEKGVAAAVGRLKQKGASADAIRKFSENAARVSTPDQIEALEREAMRSARPPRARRVRSQTHGGRRRRELARQRLVRRCVDGNEGRWTRDLG
jgi:hypothetical protein